MNSKRSTTSASGPQQAHQTTKSNDSELLFQLMGCIDKPQVLRKAAEQGKADVVKLMLEQKTAVDAIDPHDRCTATALLYAASHGHIPVMAILLANGARLSLPPHKCKGYVAGPMSKGQTVLTLTAANGHAGAVKLLLENNMDVDQCDQFGKNALYWASRYNHLAVVKVLLEFGTTNIYQATQIAKEVKNSDVEKYLTFEEIWRRMFKQQGSQLRNFIQNCYPTKFIGQNDSITTALHECLQLAQSDQTLYQAICKLLERYNDAAFRMFISFIQDKNNVNCIMAILRFS